MINPLRRNTVCITGHRRIVEHAKLPLYWETRALVAGLAAIGYTHYLCGGAIGFDTLAGNAVMDLRDRGSEHYQDIRLHLVLPCRDQEARWSERDKAHYRLLLNRADSITYISEDYTPTCMMDRNCYMVSHSNMCIAYLLNRMSGTGKTVEMAVAQKLILINMADIGDQLARGKQD